MGDAGAIAARRIAGHHPRIGTALGIRCDVLQRGDSVQHSAGEFRGAGWSWRTSAPRLLPQELPDDENHQCRLRADCRIDRLLYWVLGDIN